VEVQELEAQKGCSAVGVPLKQLQLPKGVRVGVIAGPERTVIAGAEDVIQPGEHVTLIGRSETVDGVRSLFERKSYPRLNVIIAGGGEVGFHLAHLLETRRFKVILMEADAARCEQLARRLNGTTILHADATRQAEMDEARVGKADVFVACMGRDEDNIVCGVEAKEVGCPRILSVVRRPDYANVLEKLGIDVAVSPREVMARQVLGLVESGPILDRSYISGRDAEVWEVEVNEGVPITKAPLKDIPLKQSSIAAIERDDFVRVPLADDQLRAGDTVVVLVQAASARDTLAWFEPPSD
jgi:trk system potassium uptake protein TrkA